MGRLLEPRLAPALFAAGFHGVLLAFRQRRAPFARRRTAFARTVPIAILIITIAILIAVAVLVAAAEAAIGLAILVAYFRNRGSIAVEDINLMKG